MTKIYRSFDGRAKKKFWKILENFGYFWNSENLPRILLKFFKFSNFQGLSWQKKLKVEFDLDLLDNGTQNLTFFSQFVKIVKVSSLDLSRFHGILRHKI